jgi:signal transduction histidine kinase
MRERIAGAFVLLALVLIALVVTIRAYTLQGFLADQEAAHERQEAQLVAAVIVDQVESGRAVTRSLLVQLVDIESRLEYVAPGGGSVVVEGSAYSTDDGVVAAEVRAGEGRVLLSTTARQLLDVNARQLTSLLMLGLLLIILAGLAGWWVASRLSAPFSALASAAGSLARGRVDVDVPDTRIPEARAIGQALRVSAAQLETRLAREREFAEYASHELRTPLTALRLELDDLAVRDDVPDDARAAAARGLRRVDEINDAAGHLVAITRQGALVEGGQVALGDLATQVTQAWGERLAEEKRKVTARADGDLELTFTPGPVEHVLELVLDEVLGGEGSVRLRFVGNPSHVLIEVPAGVASPPPHLGVTAARELAEQQGGRVTGDLVESGLAIHMPRR